MQLPLPSTTYRTGAKDATKVLQGLLDRCDGDVFRLPKGRYRTTEPLKTPPDRDMEILCEPGSWIEPEPFDGPVFQVSSGKDSLARHRCILRNVGIRGKLPTDPKGIGKQHGIVCVGGGGENGIAAHGLSIYDARIERLSGHGIHFEHVYGANVYGAWVQWCGVGVWCSATNGTSFYGLSTKYNFYGDENIQSRIGGIVEGNMSDGSRYTEPGGVRYSAHDVWFEQNNLQSVPGAADINAGDPRGEWKPSVLSLSGCTTFHNSYSIAGVDERKVPTHNIKGCLHLATSGAMRFYYPNKWHSFSLHPWSTITDGAAGNAMKDVTNGFDGPVNYGRAETKRIGE